MPRFKGETVFSFFNFKRILQILFPLKRYIPRRNLQPAFNESFDFKFEEERWEIWFKQNRQIEITRWNGMLAYFLSGAIWAKQSSHCSWSRREFLPSKVIFNYMNQINDGEVLLKHDLLNVDIVRSHSWKCCPWPCHVCKGNTAPLQCWFHHHHHYQHITRSKYFLCKGVRSDSVGEGHCQSKGESETSLMMMILTFILMVLMIVTILRTRSLGAPPGPNF